MDIRYLDGADSKLYMRFEQPIKNAQGMAIWQDRAFILYDTGVCAVYDLKERSGKVIDHFKLGSYNDGTPTRDYLNHANSCMFSGIHHNGNPIPLLYVVIGTGIGTDEDGYFYRCAVEDITMTLDEQGRETYSARTIQIITYKPEGIESTPFEQPCWGCPASFVDSEKNAFYLFSARYRTKKGCVPEGEHNAYIITRFELPDPAAGGMVRLTPADIVDQFAAQSDMPFTQGGTLLDDKIYYTYGCPKIGYHDAILVFDLKERCVCAQVDNMDRAFDDEEIECCAVYDGKLLCNTCTGSIYVVKDGVLPFPAAQQ